MNPATTAKVDTLVIGAGVSGLMMGYILKNNYLILEKAQELNFKVNAPFYLHSPIDWLPTRWKSVDIHQNCWEDGHFRRIPDIGMMNRYARKITGKVIDTSLKFMDGRTKQGFLPQNGEAGAILADLFAEVKDNVLLGETVESINLKTKIAQVGEKRVQYNHLINTAPLPAFLKMARMEFGAEKFVSEPVYVKLFGVDPEQAVDAYQIIYITDENFAFYRIALMHNTIYAESMSGATEVEARRLFNLVWGFSGGDINFLEEKMVLPGKFHPIEKTKRKMFLAHLTEEYGVFCLGRYAVWDYKRIDHIAKDAKDILEMIHAKKQEEVELQSDLQKILS